MAGLAVVPQAHEPLAVWAGVQLVEVAGALMVSASVGEIPPARGPRYI